MVFGATADDVDLGLPPARRMSSSADGPLRKGRRRGGGRDEEAIAGAAPETVVLVLGNFQGVVVLDMGLVAVSFGDDYIDSAVISCWRTPITLKRPELFAACDPGADCYCNVQPSTAACSSGVFQVEPEVRLGVWLVQKVPDSCGVGCGVFLRALYRGRDWRLERGIKHRMVTGRHAPRW